MQPDMPVFVTPKGKLRPRLTKHFIERYYERFRFDIGNNPAAHFTKVLMNSVVISSLPGQAEDDYYIYHWPSGRIFCMVGYMGVFATCYSANTSKWFIAAKADKMRWPTFGEVFGHPIDHDFILKEGHKKKLQALREKAIREEHEEYLKWYQKEREVKSIEIHPID